MTTFVEDARDVNVEGIEFYIKSAEDSTLYTDSECTKKATLDEIEHAFNMGDIIIVYGDNRSRAVNCSKSTIDGAQYAIITYITSEIEDDTWVNIFKQANSFDQLLVATVDIDPNKDLLGKKVGDLQEDIEITDSEITGTLKYVTGYTDFWPSRPDRQEGNYLALYINSNETEDIYVEVINGESGPVKLDSDHIVVLRITNNDQKVKVTCGDMTKEYSLENLTLASK